MKAFDKLTVASLCFLATALTIPWLAGCKVTPPDQPASTSTTDSSTDAMKSEKDVAFEKHCTELNGKLSVDALSHPTCTKPDGSVESE